MMHLLIQVTTLLEHQLMVMNQLRPTPIVRSHQNLMHLMSQLVLELELILALTLLAMAIVLNSSKGINIVMMTPPLLLLLMPRSVICCQ